MVKTNNKDLLIELCNNFEKYISFEMYEVNDKIDDLHNNNIFKIEKYDYIIVNYEKRKKNNYVIYKLYNKLSNSIEQKYRCIRVMDTLELYFNLINILTNFNHYYKTKNKIIFRNGLKKIEYFLHCDGFVILFNDKIYKYDLFELINNYDKVLHIKIKLFLLKLINFKIMCYINDNGFINRFYNTGYENNNIINYNLLYNYYESKYTLNYKYFYHYELIERGDKKLVRIAKDYENYYYYFKKDEYDDYDDFADYGDYDDNYDYYIYNYDDDYDDDYYVYDYDADYYVYDYYYDYDDDADKRLELIIRKHVKL